MFFLVVLLFSVSTSAADPIDSALWARLKKLKLYEDSDAGKAFPQPPQESTGSVLQYGDEVFVAYPDRQGNIITRIWTASGWSDSVNATDGYPRRAGEKWDMPRVILGPDDVIWIAYLSQVRRRVFFHRWLGDMWGPRIDGRGIFHVNQSSSGEFTEELRPIADILIEGSRIRNVVEMSLTSSDEPSITRVESIGMIHTKVAPGESVIFIDARDVSQTEGLVWEPYSAVKNADNPIFSANSNPDAPDAVRTFNRGTVLRENGKFRMWYSAVGSFSPDIAKRAWQTNMRVCYAESKDGIHWDRPDLGMIEYNGSKHNNIVPGILRNPTIYFDPSEPDPDRRYKCFGPATILRSRKEGALSTSADGLYWRKEQSTRQFPGTRTYWGLEFQSVFRDESDPNPERRWKAYGLFSTDPKRRATQLSTSSNGVNWISYPENPVIEPLQGVSHCIHDFIVWQESGRYVGLLQVGDELHNYGWEVVVSRDAVHFSKVADGLAFIGRGGDDSWDRGSIQAASPVRVGDEWWFYYGGMEKPWSSYPHEFKQTWTTRMHCGLATIGVGRYAGFRLREGSDRGVLTSRPLQCDFDRELTLTLNAFAAENNSIRVAIIDARTDRPLDGYSFADCVVNESDGVAIPIRWKEHKQVKLQRKISVRIQIELNGYESKLYGFAWGKD